MHIKFYLSKALPSSLRQACELDTEDKPTCSVPVSWVLASISDCLRNKKLKILPFVSISPPHTHIVPLSSPFFPSSFFPSLSFFLYQHLEFLPLKGFGDAFRAQMTWWWDGWEVRDLATMPNDLSLSPHVEGKELNPSSCPLTYTCPVVLVPPVNKHKKLNDLIILQLSGHYRNWECLHSFCCFYWSQFLRG